MTRVKDRLRESVPMTTDELFAEFDYLTGCGVHPLLAAQELHRKPSSIVKRAREHDRDDIAESILKALKTRNSRDD